MQQYIVQSNGRKTAATEVTCLHCKSIFLKSSYEIKRSKSRKNFCSLDCKNKSSQNRLHVQCELCHCYFERTESRTKKVKVSGLQFCSRSCKDLAQRLSSSVVGLRPKGYKNGYSVYRRIAFENKGRQCEHCQITNELVLCVHHKDRDRSNNSIDNLEVLCYNCHVLVHRTQYNGV